MSVKRWTRWINGVQLTKQISLDACIHQPTEQISELSRSMPKFILCDESKWPVNYSPFSQGEILPPNPLCAFTTQHMWSLQMQHKDGWYSAPLLNTEMSDIERWLYIVILCCPIFFKKVQISTHIFLDSFQHMYSNTEHYAVQICSVSVFRLASTKTSTTA